MTLISLQADVAIIGSGIVGLATAYQALRRRPGTKIVLLDKESGVGRHQTSHNSGVLHTGIYYRPGSLRAVNCREGKKAMEAFCAEEGIPFELCGKVIVATRSDELVGLRTLYERGQTNGVVCELIGPKRLRELEPHAAGIEAIHVPGAGIVDYAAICGRLVEKVRGAGGTILLNAGVTAVDARGGTVVLQNKARDVEAKIAVNCAGLYSDRIARLGKTNVETQIVPFRGEFYKLRPHAEGLVKALIYPVPDPQFPFLGVHFTKLIEGGVECGPNAVLAFAREGYTKTAINLRDLAESLTYPGFLRMAAKHWQVGLGEMWRSVNKAAFVRALQRLVPDLAADDLEPAAAGVRAQALSRDGRLVDDFVIEESDRMIHVLNAPSPAATSSLNIGSLIVDRLVARLK